MKFKRIAIRGLLILWVAIPFVLFFLPNHFFNGGDSICLSQVFLNTECPGCGITRAVYSAIQFNFIEAWQYNKLVVIVLPVLFFIWVKTALFLYGTTLIMPKEN